MTYKERLKTRTGIKNLKELLKQDPREVLRTPSLGIQTMKGAILELTKEEFGEWYNIFLTALFEETMVEKTDGYWCNLSRK